MMAEISQVLTCSPSIVRKGRAISHMSELTEREKRFNRRYRGWRGRQRSSYPPKRRLRSRSTGPTTSWRGSLRTQAAGC